MITRKEKDWVVVKLHYKTCESLKNLKDRQLSTYDLVINDLLSQIDLLKKKQEVYVLRLNDNKNKDNK